MRRSVIVVAGAAVVATGTTVGLTSTQAFASHTPTKPGHRFTVVERALTDTVVDIGPKGDSRGDLLAFQNPIFSANNKKRMGKDNGSCVRTKARSAYECSWTLTLKHGSIVVEGPFYDTKDSDLAITGGTGDYATARGRMHLHARNAKGTAYDFTYILR